jgi:hypothetical protein
MIEWFPPGWQSFGDMVVGYTQGAIGVSTFFSHMSSSA